jgi:hypothetical protein
LPIASSTSGNLNVKRIQFPLSGGVISSEEAHIPLDIKNPVLFNENPNNVDVSEVLVKNNGGKVIGVIGKASSFIRDKTTSLRRWIGGYFVVIIPTDEELVKAPPCKSKASAQMEGALLRWENEGGKAAKINQH